MVAEPRVPYSSHCNVLGCGNAVLTLAELVSNRWHKTCTKVASAGDKYEHV
jgi:hypothetical protein